MPTPWKVLLPAWIGVSTALLCGSVEAQDPPGTASVPQATAVDVWNLQPGGLYRLSAETFVVMEPEPELHTVPGVSAGAEHIEAPPLVPSSTVVRIARRSVTRNVIWYELRTPDREKTYGWVSAEELQWQEVTRIE
jgi:hypothetical protein